MDGKYVFISYRSEDSEQANWIKNTLELNGIPCWIDNKSIHGGNNFSNEIPNAIDGCSAFVLVLTKNSQGSKWVEREVIEADKSKKRILPFVLDETPLNKSFGFLLNTIQMYNAVTNPEKEIENLIRDIREEFNAPAAKVKVQKKAPKTKNNSEKKKMKLWKKILVALILLPFIISVASFLVALVSAPLDTENNSASETSSQNLKNNYAGIFDNYDDNNHETEATTSTANILDNLTFELDGVTYSLPCNVSDLYANGWVCETREEDEIQNSFYVELKKGNSSIWIETYPPFIGEEAKFIDQKVGTIEYTSDCNVSFSVNGTIQPGSHYNDIIAEFGEPNQNSSWGNNTEYKYYTHGSGGYLPYATFLFYTDTSRCYSIKLENEVYSKKY